MKADRGAVRPLAGLTLFFGGLVVAFSSLRFGAEGRSALAVGALALGLLAAGGGIWLVGRGRE